VKGISDTNLQPKACSLSVQWKSVISTLSEPWPHQFVWLQEYKGEGCSLFELWKDRKLTTQSKALLEKLIVSQLVQKFSAFYETRRFIIMLTWPATEPYPELNESIPHLPTLFLEDPF
jgi:hypothetical protein